MPKIDFTAILVSITNAPNSVIATGSPLEEGINAASSSDFDGDINSILATSLAKYSFPLNDKCFQVTDALSIFKAGTLSALADEANRRNNEINSTEETNQHLCNGCFNMNILVLYWKCISP